MKKILLTSLLLLALSLSSFAQTSLSQEQITEIAKQAILANGNATAEWFGGFEKATFYEDEERWNVFFDTKGDEVGDAFIVVLTPDGEVVYINRGR